MLVKIGVAPASTTSVPLASVEPSKVKTPFAGESVNVSPVRSRAVAYCTAPPPLLIPSSDANVVEPPSRSVPPREVMVEVFTHDPARIRSVPAVTSIVPSLVNCSPTMSKVALIVSQRIVPWLTKPETPWALTWEPISAQPPSIRTLGAMVRIDVPSI